MVSERLGANDFFVLSSGRECPLQLNEEVCFQALNKGGTAIIRPYALIKLHGGFLFIKNFGGLQIMEKKPFYITTPIYYPSDKLHIGHSYTTVAADAIARYKRMKGYDVYFLTGSDEHGQKIERKAKERGITPKQYVDEIVASFQSLWRLMDISNDGFVRTTDDYHVKAVQKIFKKLYDQGDIYKSTYSGYYCTPCESHWLERQLVNGCCPDCGRPVEIVEEIIRENAQDARLRNEIP